MQSYEITRLTCDRCSAKVTRITNVGSGRCVCDDCVSEVMNQRIGWWQEIMQGPMEIIKIKREDKDGTS